MAKATRVKANAALKEDIKHVLEELWGIEEEEPFYKIFTKRCIGAKSVHYVAASDKAELEKLTHEDEEGIFYLEDYEINKMRMLLHYRSHLVATGKFPEDADSFRCNTMPKKDYRSFANHPDCDDLIRASGDITAKAPRGSGLADYSKSTYSPADSFKRSIKRDASIFTTFKDSKQWDTWRRNTVATARAQDVAEVLNPNYRAVTAEDKALFKEKQKFMHAVFDKTLQTDRGKKHVREHEEDFNA